MIDNILTRVDDRTSVPIGEMMWHLRVSAKEESGLVLDILRAAEEHVETVTNCLLRPTDCEVKYECWPYPFELPRWPAENDKTNLTIDYWDSADAQQTLADGDYALSYKSNLPAEIHLDMSSLSLSEEKDRPYPLVVSYRAGFATVPARFKRAVKIVGKLFWDEGMEAHVPMMIKNVLNTLRPGFVPGALGVRIG